MSVQPTQSPRSILKPPAPTPSPKHGRIPSIVHHEPTIERYNYENTQSCWEWFLSLFDCVFEFFTWLTAKNNRHEDRHEKGEEIELEPIVHEHIPERTLAERLHDQFHYALANPGERIRQAVGFKDDIIDARKGIFVIKLSNSGYLVHQENYGEKPRAQFLNTVQKLQGEIPLEGAESFELLFISIKVGEGRIKTTNCIIKMYVFDPQALEPSKVRYIKNLRLAQKEVFKKFPILNEAGITTKDLIL